MLHFVKQFAGTLTVQVVILLLHNRLFLVHVDFHVARGPTRFFASSVLLHFFMCWFNLLLPVSQSQNLNPQIYMFSTFHDLGAKRCSCMVPLIWHTPIIVGSPPWGPGHGQSFLPPSLYLINLMNPVLEIFRPHPEVSYLQVCNSLFMCSKS